MESYHTPAGKGRWSHLIVEGTVAQVGEVLVQGQVASSVTRFGCSALGK